MQIFTHEKEDGLETKITSSASFSYASIAEPCVVSDVAKINSVNKTLAALDDSDLYYVQSILVTSSWNKNDDIFDKSEVWLARKTPEDKPTNLEHDENLIIGHITNNWPITESGDLIDETVALNDLPEKYHILTGSVIYRAFTSPELKDRSEKLIADIEAGSMFVSMECFFKGFDYGLLDKTNGSYKTLARNENTAYLTKYLRAYGGLGEHDNYKIGRVLRNITFSGKGFVEKPANPDSIIFTKDTIDKLFDQKNNNLLIAGVSNNQLTSKVENHIMSSEQEVVEVKLETETNVATEVVDKTSELETAIQAKDESIAMLGAELENLKAQYEALAKKLKEEEEKNEVEDKKESKKEEEDEEETEAAKKKMKAEMDAKDEELKKTKSELSAALEAIAGYMKQEEDMAKKEKKMKRKASLLSCGFDDETSEATLEKFESLNDDAFDAMTNLLAGKMPPWLEKFKKGDDEETDKTKDAKKKASIEETVDSSILENVEVEEAVNLGVGSDTQSSVDTTRAELIEFVCARLGKKLNKGE
jgi:hypothetical protein